MKTIGDGGTLSVLAARLEGVTATQPRVWGTMSAHQMLVHLGDAAEAALGLRPFGAPSRPGSRIVKWIALRVPLPWPRELRSGADPARRMLPTEVFAADRDRAVRSLRALAAADDGTLAARHPIFGRMSRRDWHRWAYLHTDHHLRQFGV